MTLLGHSTRCVTLHFVMTSRVLFLACVLYAVNCECLVPGVHWCEGSLHNKESPCDAHLTGHGVVHLTGGGRHPRLELSQTFPSHATRALPPTRSVRPEAVRAWQSCMHLHHAGPGVPGPINMYE